MDVVWDGITLAETLQDDEAQLRHELARAAKRYEWSRVLDIVSEHVRLINTTRPCGKSLFTPLHHAAHGGAPIKTVRSLLALGAWRSLQNARGERPVDVATCRGHRHLLKELHPRIRHDVPQGILLELQKRFHEVIRGRAGAQIQEHQLWLPELEPLLELDEPQMWFAVPGMHGGFKYWLQTAGVDAKLLTESWCRVVEGSGQRHEITSSGSALVEEGFV